MGDPNDTQQMNTPEPNSSGRSSDPGPLEMLCFDIYQDLRSRLDLPHSTCTSAMRIVLSHIHDYGLPLDKRRLERIVHHDLQASLNCQALLQHSTDSTRAVAVAQKIAEMQTNQLHEANEWLNTFLLLYSLCEKMNPFWLQRVMLGADDDQHLLRNLVLFRIHSPLWNVPGCEPLCYTWCRILRSLIEQQQLLLTSNDAVTDQAREAVRVIELICDKLISYSVTNEIVNDLNTLAYRHFTLFARRNACGASFNGTSQLAAAQRCESRTSSRGSTGRSSRLAAVAAADSAAALLLPNMQLFYELVKLAIAMYSACFPASTRVFYSLDEWHIGVLENLLNDAQCLALGRNCSDLIPKDIVGNGNNIEEDTDTGREMAEHIFVLLIAVHYKAVGDDKGFDERNNQNDSATNNSIVTEALAAAATHAHAQTVTGTVANGGTRPAVFSTPDARGQDRCDSTLNSYRASVDNKRDSLGSDDMCMPVDEDGQYRAVGEQSLSSSQFGAVLLSWFNRRYDLRKHHVACDGWKMLCRFLIDIAAQSSLTYVMHANDLPVFIDICKRHVRNNAAGHEDRIACLKILRNLHRNLTSSTGDCVDADEVLVRCTRKIVKFFASLDADRRSTKDSPCSTEVDLTRDIGGNSSSAPPFTESTEFAAGVLPLVASSGPPAVEPAAEIDDEQRRMQLMRITAV